MISGNRQSQDALFVAVLNIPSPYRIHLLGELARNLSRRRIRLHVHFMARGHAERPGAWRNPEIPFAHTYWRDWGWKTHHLNPGLLLHLMRNPAPDCLLVGSAWDTLTGLFASVLARRKLGVLWTEGNTKTPGRLDGILGHVKRFILRRYDRVAVPGREGVGYVALHQRRTSRKLPSTVLLPNIVDERRFRVRDLWRDEAVGLVRESLGVGPSQRLALCPARLEPVKGLVEFVNQLTPDTLLGWRLVIVGEGSQRDRLAACIERRGLTQCVALKNNMPYEDMPAIYAAADLFVLPSRHDSNPLSVVEAMHSGLPLLLSKQVGNYPEALVEGETGWGFSPFHAEEIDVAVRAAFGASAQELKGIGQAAKRQAERGWGSEMAIRAFANSLGFSPVEDTRE